MHPVTFARLQAWLVEVPLNPEWSASPELGGHMSGPPRLILRVEDRDGHFGWGEGATTLAPDSIRSVLRKLARSELPQLRPADLDLWPEPTYYQRPAAPSPHAPNLANLRHRNRHPLQGAVEMSCLDLIARRAGLPLYMLFGGKWRDAIPTDYWMGRVTPGDARRCVARGRALGFHGVKLKATLEDDNVAVLEAIKAEAGPAWSVTVDPNGRFYRLSDALPQIQAMDAVGNMQVLEDPFPRFHLAEFAALRARIQARVVVHIDPPESLHQVIASGAAGGLNLDSHVQGLTAWRMAAATADAANLPIWHGSGLDLGIATAAQLHACAATPNCQLPGDQAGPWIRTSSLLRTPLVVRHGRVEVPAGPGLGVEVDCDALENHTRAQFDERGA